MIERLEIADLIEKVNSGIDGRNEVISMIYSNPKIKQKIILYVKKQGGSNDEAEDVFTDSILAFVKMCRKKVKIQSSFSAYFFGIAKYVWFGKIRSKQSTKEIAIEENEFIEDLDPYSYMVDGNRRRILNILLQQLDQKCREVLSKWAYSFKMSEIATEFGYASEGMARKKKYTCLQKLLKIIEANPKLALELKSL